MKLQVALSATMSRSDCREDVCFSKGIQGLGWDISPHSNCVEMGLLRRYEKKLLLPIVVIVTVKGDDLRLRWFSQNQQPRSSAA